MLPAVHDAIVRAAKENGLDPSMALAIADRESSGDVNGRAPGSSAYGLFQLLKSERSTYGGNSTDPYEQATAWARYIKGTRSEMEHHLGRTPTGPELYLGHYFGGGRAARLVSGQIPGQTPVSAVFSPQELTANPNIRGTTGALSSSVMADIARRQGKYAGAGPESDAGNSGTDFDPAKWGTPVGGDTGIRPSAPPPAGALSPGGLEKFGSPVEPPQASSMPPPMPAPGTTVPYTSGQSIV